MSLTGFSLPRQQAHTAHSEFGRIDRGVGRRLAQLSPRVPVGLQGCRDRRIRVERHYHVVGLLRPYRLGVRS